MRLQQQIQLAQEYVAWWNEKHKGLKIPKQGAAFVRWVDARKAAYIRLQRHFGEHGPAMLAMLERCSSFYKKDGSMPQEKYLTELLKKVNQVKA